MVSFVSRRFANIGSTSVFCTEPSPFGSSSCSHSKQSLALKRSKRPKLVQSFKVKQQPYREVFLFLFLCYVAFHRLKDRDQVVGRNLALLLFVECVKCFIELGKLLFGQQIGLFTGNDESINTGPWQALSKGKCVQKWTRLLLPHAHSTERVTWRGGSPLTISVR